MFYKEVILMKKEKADKFFPYFVVLGVVAMVAIVTIVFNSTDGVEGAAIGKEQAEEYTQGCVDDDPQSDLYFAGTVKQGKIDYKDHCRDDVLYQYKCEHSFADFTPPYQCPNGCQDGVCLP